jgi:hypothetical protein
MLGLESWIFINQNKLLIFSLAFRVSLSIIHFEGVTDQFMIIPHNIDALTNVHDLIQAAQERGQIETSVGSSTPTFLPKGNHSIPTVPSYSYMQEALNGTKVPDGSGTSLNIK